MKITTLVEHPTLIADASHTAQTLTRLAGEYRTAEREAISTRRLHSQLRREARQLDAAARLLNSAGIRVNHVDWMNVTLPLIDQQQSVREGAEIAAREMRDAKAALLAEVLATF